MHIALIFLTTVLCTLNTYGTSETYSHYFDTHFLRSSDLVQKTLIDDGFQKGFFTTNDGHSLAYLWLARPQARFTIIFCTGFWPGKKEGLASFFALMPNDCNMLLFDARGHGESSGSFIKSIWTYGSTEYRDIIGAINFAHTQSDCPIIVHGICSGAFHATHAILELQKESLLDKYPIRGIVFDSGWNNIWTVAKSALYSEILKRINRIFPKFMEPLNTYSLNISIACTHAILTPLYNITPHKEPLSTAIKNLSIPVLYIHMIDDRYSEFCEVAQLHTLTPRTSHWWITEQSKHACHHLKHQHAYRERLLQFIDEVL